jgi:hypothetical protein
MHVRFFDSLAYFFDPSNAQAGFLSDFPAEYAVNSETAFSSTAVICSDDHPAN